ncbi:MAG TPA: S8 family serine peptidase [Jatrophihabitans sp.]|jgi:hypothetical protein
MTTAAAVLFAIIVTLFCAVTPSRADVRPTATGTGGVRTCTVGIGIHCMGVALPRVLSATPTVGPATDSYGPADFASAYRLPAATGFTDVASRPIVAVIDAYHSPNVYADLSYYRSFYNMPFNADGSCPQAVSNDPTEAWCFKQADQRGNVPSTAPIEPHPGQFSWADETTLDVEMVAAVCAQCRILLVEADNADSVYDSQGRVKPSGPNMEKAVLTAVGLGAQYISMSWGQGEYAGELSDNANYYKPDSNGDGAPDVLYVAAAGDNGYDPDQGVGPAWPANSSNVVSVGGTSLTRAPGTARGWRETAWGSSASMQSWGGTGSGCSSYERRPSWQSALTAISAACPKRMGTDVSIVADPRHGVAVYEAARRLDGSLATADPNDSVNWQTFGGTSAGTPMIAALFALAGNHTDRTAPYSHPDQFNDVTSGRNVADKIATCAIACFATTGWDGPTGVGTPNGLGGFAPGGIVLRNPGPERVGVHKATIGWKVTSNTAGATYALTSGALPHGLVLGPDGIVRGKPKDVGSGQAVITATLGTAPNPVRTGATVLSWNVLHVFVAGKPKTKGAFRTGVTLHAAVGTLRRDSRSGRVVHPKPKLQWLKDGKPIPGATKSKLKLTSKLTGHRISLRCTLATAGYLTLTATSKAGRVR